MNARGRVKVILLHHLVVLVLHEKMRSHLLLLGDTCLMLLVLHKELMLLLGRENGLSLVVFRVCYLLMWLHLIIKMILLIVFYI